MEQPTISSLGGSLLHRVSAGLLGSVFEGEDVTMVRRDIPADRPTSPYHSFAEHEQSTIVIGEAVETTVGNEVLTLLVGEMCRVERDVMHGSTRDLEGANAVLFDVFSPPRADYVAAARKGAYVA